jgi:hypothetical protein
MKKEKRLKQPALFIVWMIDDVTKKIFSLFSSVVYIVSRVVE